MVNKYRIWFGVMLLLILLTSNSSCQSGLPNIVNEVSTSYIFSIGEFPACHASTIIELDSSKLLASWFAGSYEGAKDVSIWGSILKKGKWGEPFKLANGFDRAGNQMPCWNPVLFKTHSGKILLFYKVGKNPREWWGEVISSNDFGINWSKSEKLPEGFLGPIKNKPIQLLDGTILCPSSVEKDNGEWSSHIEITNENLDSWVKVNIEKNPSDGIIQPSILHHEGDTLQILCRTRQDLVFESWSYDNGKTWSKLKSTEIPNPNSGIDAVTLNDNNFLLVYNPLLSGEEWSEGRNKLNIAISPSGKVWHDIYQLENETKGEFSYPAVIQSSNGSIHITYTYDRKTIKYVKLNISQ